MSIIKRANIMKLIMSLYEVKIQIFMMKPI